ncbi:MAG TPA: adenylate/guanylate cyclase domain-containing protein [Candidatus Limnocylindrales bacterium]|nr:adenylate/guanylate cyclase domain-containing protein [Candidatus Limnocylindrales bacterium]
MKRSVGGRGPEGKAARSSGLFWLLAGTLLSVGAHLVATGLARLIGRAMRGTSDLATQAILVHRPFDQPYVIVAFVVVTGVSLAYLLPLIRFFLDDDGLGNAEPSPAVQRRAIGAPLALSAITIVPWIGGIATFVAVTITSFGRWSDDMLSEQVITPALSGFVAATAQYLMLEWVFRERIVPLVFPEGGLRAVRRAPFLPVTARLVVLAFALGFIPAFALLGVIAAANDRVVAAAKERADAAAKERAAAAAKDRVVAAGSERVGAAGSERVGAAGSDRVGAAGDDRMVAAGNDRAVADLADTGIMDLLQRNAGRIFVFFILTGAGYVWMFARSLTVPLGELTRALAGIRDGNLDVHVAVRTRDELGSLAEGVNELARSMREKSHILATFGRIVDPAVRDRLLAGEVSPRGERREVAVLFADVRAFTRMAEKSPPEEVVETLNELFRIMSAGVKRAGGTVDKFVGDAMLAVFGLFDLEAETEPESASVCDPASVSVPGPNADHAPASSRAAAAAIECALRLRSDLDAFAATRVQAGGEPVRVLIAVHAGPVVAATLGAEDRFDYTVVGDAVNVTSRLLDVAKERSRAVVISADAVHRAEQAGAKIAVDWCGSVELRGRTAAIEVCTVAGA